MSSNSRIGKNVEQKLRRWNSALAWRAERYGVVSEVGCQLFALSAFLLLVPPAERRFVATDYARTNLSNDQTCPTAARPSSLERPTSADPSILFKLPGRTCAVADRRDTNCRSVCLGGMPPVRNTVDREENTLKRPRNKQSLHKNTIDFFMPKTNILEHTH